MLTGSFAFAADKEEEREIGTALAECLETLPSPISETLNKGGPWIKLTSLMGGAVLKRMKIVQMANEQKKRAAQGNVTQMRQPPPQMNDPTQGVSAPDPSGFSFGNNDSVIAPEPISAT